MSRSTLGSERIQLTSTMQSLGCTLFALAYSHSPFEDIRMTEQGGSIAMAVLNAQYKHPQSAYSQGLKDLIDSMLKVNPTERPDINEVSFCICLICFPLIFILFLGYSKDRWSIAITGMMNMIFVDSDFLFGFGYGLN